MSNRLVLMSFLGLGIILAAQETAQRARAQSARPSAISSQASGEASSYMLRGKSVKGPDGKEVGSFNEFLFTSSGQITAIVINVGGFLGMGMRAVALPYSTLHYSVRNGGIITDLSVPFSEADLKRMPQFQYLKGIDKK